MTAGEQAGSSVSLTGRVDILAIGAPFNDNNGQDAGQARIYRFNKNTQLWELTLSIDGEAAGDQFGQSVMTSFNDGDILALGAPFNDGNTGNINDNRGHVRLYRWNSTAATWLQLGSDIDGKAPGDQFGTSISLSRFGNVIAIGAPFNDDNGQDAGQVRVYVWNGSAWVQRGGDINGEAAGDNFGWSISLSLSRDNLAIGAPFNDGNTGNINDNRGHVRIYTWDGTTWQQIENDIDGEEAHDQSGWSVSFFDNSRSDPFSTLVAIGAPFNDGNTGNDLDNRGHVRLYNFNGTTWQQRGGDIDGVASGDESGFFVSLELVPQQNIVIGSRNNDGSTGNSSDNRGSVRVFNLIGDTFEKNCSDIDGKTSGELFGSVVSGNTTFAASAPFNDSNGLDAGQVRVYARGVPVITGDPIICADGSTYTYQIERPQVNVNYDWYFQFPNGFDIISGQGTPQISAQVNANAESNNTIGVFASSISSINCTSGNIFNVQVDKVLTSKPSITQECNKLFTNATTNLEWLRDGIIIPGANTPELTLSQQGQYQVRLNGGCNILLSDPFDVTTLSLERQELSSQAKLQYVAQQARLFIRLMLLILLSLTPGQYPMALKLFQDKVLLP